MISISNLIKTLGILTNLYLKDALSQCSHFPCKYLIFCTNLSATRIPLNLFNRIKKYLKKLKYICYYYSFRNQTDSSKSVKSSMPLMESLLCLFQYRRCICSSLWVPTIAMFLAWLCCLCQHLGDQLGVECLLLW